MHSQGSPAVLKIYLSYCRAAAALQAVSVASSRSVDWNRRHLPRWGPHDVAEVARLVEIF